MTFHYVHQIPFLTFPTSSRQLRTCVRESSSASTTSLGSLEGKLERSLSRWQMERTQSSNRVKGSHPNPSLLSRMCHAMKVRFVTGQGDRIGVKHASFIGRTGEGVFFLYIWEWDRIKHYIVICI